MKANEAAKLYANTHTEWFDSEGNPNVAPAFEAGAQWADKTMIEKACEWLLNNINYYIIIDKTKFGVDWPKVKAELFDDFKKAMEE